MEKVKDHIDLSVCLPMRLQSMLKQEEGFKKKLCTIWDQGRSPHRHKDTGNNAITAKGVEVNRLCSRGGSLRMHTPTQRVKEVNSLCKKDLLESAKKIKGGIDKGQSHFHPSLPALIKSSHPSPSSAFQQHFSSFLLIHTSLLKLLELQQSNFSAAHSFWHIIFHFFRLKFELFCIYKKCNFKSIKGLHQVFIEKIKCITCTFPTALQQSKVRMTWGSEQTDAEKLRNGKDVRVC